MRALLQSPEIQAAVDKCAAYAVAQRFNIHDLKHIQAHPERAAGNDPHFRLTVPMGFHCVFTIEQHPGGWMRHLSVSVGGDKYPNERAVEALGQMFGFKTPFAEWFKWLEEEARAVNVLEKL